MVNKGNVSAAEGAEINACLTEVKLKAAELGIPVLTPEKIKNNDEIKPIASYQKKYSMMLNSIWYFIAIVLLLGIEWFLRKWNGGF